MEQLVKLITAKAGISEAQAKQSIETIVDFLKDKMPAGIGSQVESFVKGGGSDMGNIAGALKDKVGSLFGK